MTCQKWRKTAIRIFKKKLSRPWKSSVDFISLINFVLKKTSMYLDLIYYYYNTKFTFFREKLISKNWPFLFDMLTKLLILDFKYFSFWLSFWFSWTSATLSMIFFKYLANNLQHPNLTGCFHEGSENKTENVFSLIFAGFYCSYGDISVNAL